MTSEDQAATNGQPVAVEVPIAEAQATAPKAAEVPTDSPTDIIYFEKWLAILGERQASDLHLTVGNVPALRVDGLIVPLSEEDVLTEERMNRIVEHILDADEMAILAKTKDVITSHTLKKILRFRIHVFYSRGFLTVSLRHLPDVEVSAVELGLPAEVIAMAKEETGLLLITGPFDSGRTATVRALLSEINHNDPRYIVTLEQPIEYLLSGDKSVVVQRQVGRDAPSFADALASLENEDVNVAAVSALPDKAAADAALKFASAGRLLIAVMENRTVLGSLEELRDFFPEEDRARALNILADCLVGVAAQILLPKVGGGRILLTEILRATAPVKSLIRDNKLRQIAQIMQTSREQGMLTLDRALADAVKAGTVALQVAREYAIDPAQFNLLVSH